MIAFDNYVGTREVCKYCLNPLKPVSKGETIEVSNDGAFSSAFVVEVTPDTLEVITNDSPASVSTYPLIKYRRFPKRTESHHSTPFQIGAPVFSAYYDSAGASDGVRHAAVIVSHNKTSNTYGVFYADNVKGRGLQTHDLRPMQY